MQPIHAACGAGGSRLRLLAPVRPGASGASPKRDVVCPSTMVMPVRHRIAALVDTGAVEQKPVHLILFGSQHRDRDVGLLSARHSRMMLWLRCPRCWCGLCPGGTRDCDTQKRCSDPRQLQQCHWTSPRSLERPAAGRVNFAGACPFEGGGRTASRGYPLNLPRPTFVCCPALARPSRCSVRAHL